MLAIGPVFLLAVVGRPVLFQITLSIDGCMGYTRIIRSECPPKPSFIKFDARPDCESGLGFFIARVNGVSSNDLRLFNVPP